MFSKLSAHELYMLERTLLSAYQNANKVYFDVVPAVSPAQASGMFMSMDIASIAIEVSDLV